MPHSARVACIWFFIGIQPAQVSHPLPTAIPMADYHLDLAEKFLRSYPDGPFDYGTIGAFLKAAKTNNTVRGAYLALEKI